MQVGGVLVKISFTETDDAEPATDDGVEGFAGGMGHGGQVAIGSYRYLCFKMGDTGRSATQRTANSLASRLSDTSQSTGMPRSQRVNWWVISPAAMLAE